MIWADVELPSVTGRVAARCVFRHDLSRRSFPQRRFVHALIGHRRAVPCEVQRQDQPVLIVDESRIDFLLYCIALALKLRALIRNLDWVALLILSFVSDRIGFWLPFPGSGR